MDRVTIKDLRELVAVLNEFTGRNYSLDAYNPGDYRKLYKLVDQNGFAVMTENRLPAREMRTLIRGILIGYQKGKGDTTNS